MAQTEKPYTMLGVVVQFPLSELKKAYRYDTRNYGSVTKEDIAVWASGFAQTRISELILLSNVEESEL